MRKAFLIMLCVMALSPARATPQAQETGWINVEGPRLESKLDAALTMARSADPAHQFFWVAYGFTVRPGVGIDIQVPGLDIGGVSTGIDSTYETQSAGLFLLYEWQGGPFAEVEIRNLDRRMSVDRYPVYWLGCPANDESLTLLQGLIESSRKREAAEKLTTAIALHDDPQVTPVLRKLFRNSRIEGVRIKAIAWLGRTPGQIPFLADAARNERENTEVRERAVMAIGRSREAAALQTLQSLYQGIVNREVKERIIDAALKSDDRSEAVKFLTTVAEHDPDAELREHAQLRLRKQARRRVER